MVKGFRALNPSESQQITEGYNLTGKIQGSVGSGQEDSVYIEIIQKYILVLCGHSLYADAVLSNTCQAGLHITK